MGSGEPEREIKSSEEGAGNTKSLSLDIPHASRRNVHSSEVWRSYGCALEVDIRTIFV